MAVFILNTMRSVRRRLTLDQAVRDAIGEREGTWRVSIGESAHKGGVWNVVIKGPSGCYWAHHFNEIELTPSDLCAAVRADMEKADAARSSKAIAAETSGV